MKRLVVLISGSGSNLQAIIDACQHGRLDAHIVAVISNCATAYGLQRAGNAHIPTHSLASADFVDRQAFDRHLAATVADYHPDLVILAGYMRILSAEFVQRFSGQLINIHPSLLPRYPGLATHQRVLENGDAEHGASVHFVTEQLDGGPVIVQGQIAVSPEDDERSLAQRIQQLEHQIYPAAIDWFISGRLQLQQGQAWLDQQPLPATGVAYCRA